MKSRRFRLVMLVVLLAILSLAGKLAIGRSALADNKSQGAGLQPPSEITQGQLRVLDKQGQPIGQCPLKHTSVSASISGFVARVDVTQEFVNTSGEKIEAVYVFPLPQDAAVDKMEMKVGERTIRGEIKKREEARQIYEAAKKAGHVASLLDQERPNIFTQSVANIVPGEKVLIKIGYVNLLKYENGQYEFVFPMVVGPRYIPGNPTGQTGQGWAPDTDRVPDASKITPPVTPEGTRAGHDISVEVEINAGTPLGDVSSVLHEVDIRRTAETSARVTLKDQAGIPNKDFILRCQVAGDAVRTGLLPSTRGDNDGYFALVLVPPKSPTPEQIAPKEMIFVIDTSGSQMGWPIEKAKETMKLCVEQMNPNDTFQMLAFSNEVVSLFDSPKPNTPENRAGAREFLSSRLGAGGTEMLKAILAALTPPPDPERLRIVCFMTDGYVGNDFQILDSVKNNVGGARMFSFGIGNSVNRFLLDGMADAGRGAVEYVTLEEKGSPVAQRFYDRISKPVLTDISIDWGGLPVVETYPRRVPDLFSSQPVIVKGRYLHEGEGTITIRGKLGGKAWQEQLKVDLPAKEDDNPAIPTLWAREKIHELTARDYAGLQRGQPDAEVKGQVTEIALEYQLMSQYTSFVAVEEMVVTEGGKPKTVAVPVEMPEGVSYEGTFGGRGSGSVGKGYAWSAVTARISKTVTAFSVGDRAAALPAPASAGAHYYAAPTVPFAAKPSSDGFHAMDSLAEGDRPQQVIAKPGLTPAERKRQLIAARLDPLLQGLSAKLDKKGNYSRRGKVEVKAGKVRISIRMSEISAANLAKLKKLGFVRLASSKAGATVIGTAHVSKLEMLAQLGFVRRIAPVM
ncbi:MAG: VIT domain-containing protein [Armatimonadota bacterium]|nr:VIT domain-containing protein [Armatimonadota bacterium]